MRIVCISDTHLNHNFHVPDGDVLVHAGDLTYIGNLGELGTAAEWLHSLPHPVKIVVAGNHELALDSGLYWPARQMLEADGKTVYLQDARYVLGPWKVWGAPWQPKFWGAFNLLRGEPLARKWALIPDDTDILITHAPPYETGDIVVHKSFGKTEIDHTGCQDLRRRVGEVKPRLHIFGHIHSGHGVYGLKELPPGDIILTEERPVCINASILNEDYLVEYNAVVVDLYDGETIIQT